VLILQTPFSALYIRGSRREKQALQEQQRDSDDTAKMMSKNTRSVSTFVEYVTPPPTPIPPPAKYKLWLVVLTLVFFADWFSDEAGFLPWIQSWEILDPNLSYFFMLGVIVFCLTYAALDLLVACFTWKIRGKTYGFGPWLRQPRVERIHKFHNFPAEVLAIIITIFEDGFKIFNAPPSIKPPMAPTHYMCKSGTCKVMLRIEHNIDPNKFDDYFPWEKKIAKAASNFEGFVSVEHLKRNEPASVYTTLHKSSSNESDCNDSFHDSAEDGVAYVREINKLPNQTVTGDNVDLEEGQQEKNIAVSVEHLKRNEAASVCNTLHESSSNESDCNDSFHDIAEDGVAYVREINKLPNQTVTGDSVDLEEGQQEKNIASALKASWVYPEGQDGPSHVVHLSFSNIDTLNEYMASSRRRKLMNELEPLLLKPDVVKIQHDRVLPDAFTELLTRQGEAVPTRPPKKWKVAWLTTVALYVCQTWTKQFLPYYFTVWNLDGTHPRIQSFVSVTLSTFFNSYVLTPLFLFLFNDWVRRKSDEDDNTQPRKTLSDGIQWMWLKCLVVLAFYGGCGLAWIVKS
jgi:antibiotic biosynthesis monooxygenase (ABM) superfamily enzyme